MGLDDTPNTRPVFQSAVAGSAMPNPLPVSQETVPGDPGLLTQGKELVQKGVESMEHAAGVFAKGVVGGVEATFNVVTAPFNSSPAMPPTGPSNLPPGTVEWPEPSLQERQQRMEAMERIGAKLGIDQAQPVILTAPAPRR